MAQTIREKIISSIVDRLEQIRIVNGYNSEIGLNVFRCRQAIDDASELPCANLWPMMDEQIDYKYGEIHATMPIKIEAFQTFTGNNASVESEKILGDLMYALTKSDPTGGYSDNLLYVGGGVESYPPDGTRIIGVHVDLEIQYYFKNDNPYSR